MLQQKQTQSGFSLVEIMVALVIGMLGVVVILQVFSAFETQRRTTSGGDDAISGGSIALHLLQRDIQHAGWGMSAVNVQACNITGLTEPAGSSMLLAPVLINPRNSAGALIIPAGDANTDTLVVVSGNGGVVEGDTILSDTGGPVGNVVQNSYVVNGVSGFKKADLVVAAPQRRTKTACNLKAVKVTGEIGATTRKIDVEGGAPFDVEPGARLFNLGQTPVVMAYAIRDGNLTMCNWRKYDCTSTSEANNRTVWVPVASNIVSLRAQYGRDTTPERMRGIVDTWDKTLPTTGISSNPNRDIPACGVMRTSAVRLVLVARSSQPEKTDDWPTLTKHVSSPVATWTDLSWMALENDSGALLGTATAAATAAAIKLPSPDASWPTWQDFRYKVFQTVVPLRNFNQQGAVEEC